VFRKIKPEESQGMVSVQQLRQAKENVNAVLQGLPAPYPPNPKDDHRAKLEVYQSTQQILSLQGQISQALDELMQIQTLLLQQQMEKEDKPGKKVNLKKPQITSV
jgi:hypothetical protein